MKEWLFIIYLILYVSLLMPSSDYPVEKKWDGAGPDYKRKGPPSGITSGEKNSHVYW